MTSSNTNNSLESDIAELLRVQTINFCNDDSESPHPLQVGGNRSQNPNMGVTAKVSLKILTEASNEFEKHENSFSKYTEHLSKCPVESVLILLDIAHGTELLVPNKASIQEKGSELNKISVANLCDLVDRADDLGLAHLLGPYLEHLMTAQYNKNKLSAVFVDIAAWLAWKIGAGILYDEMIDHLAFICELDELGNVLRPGSNGAPIFKHTLHDTSKDSDEVPANVAFVREERLKDVIGELRHAVSLGNGSKECIANDVSENERVKCTNAIHDYMTQESRLKISQKLDINGLDQVFLGGNTSTYRGSIKDLRQRLLAVKCEAAHETCDPFSEMRKVFQKEPGWTPLELAMKRQEHFKKQAETFKWTLN
ncbi:uncharacterized protein CLUP02_04996 [Colletotrichum lupini]|uniref:Uncharacterized protein n=1 Tax=Colletotrichum lupini TaxID=145971 RepID=A0A9Q8SLD6_9PEZI|nr:uncharacterized protein CLUP02_04996 [Colletotrichum lupini]UQC79516.1 hypothetical protein CLUP02_04996 [Colletotrichum lupini]